MKLSLLGIRYIFLLGSVFLLSSCSMFDWLRDDDKVVPAELVKFDEEVQLRRIWSVNVGDGQGDKYNRLEPVMSGERIYAASNDGIVIAVNRENGRTVWRSRLDYIITGGVGASNGLVLVGTENSQVLALDAETGSIRWVVEVTSEVLSAPATDGRVVVVQTADGNLIGLDAQTGNQTWIYENPVPALSLRGTSNPVIIQNFVIAALANGSVISVALDNGTLRWEERVAIPTGRSEIDRLVDIDGALVVVDNQILVSSYQGYLASIDAITGQTRWRVAESSSNSPSSGFGNIYIANVDDILAAYRTSQDTQVWQNDQMTHRRLSSPLGFSNYVAVGDFEGYVHLLAQSDGRFVGRTKVDGDGIRVRMLSQGNNLFVYGNSGTLAAYRVQ